MREENEEENDERRGKAKRVVRMGRRRCDAEAPAENVTRMTPPFGPYVEEVDDDENENENEEDDLVSGGKEESEEKNDITVGKTMMGQPPHTRGSVTVCTVVVEEEEKENEDPHPTTPHTNNAEPHAMMKRDAFSRPPLLFPCGTVPRWESSKKKKKEEKVMMVVEVEEAEEEEEEEKEDGASTISIVVPEEEVEGKPLDGTLASFTPCLEHGSYTLSSSVSARSHDGLHHRSAPQEENEGRYERIARRNHKRRGSGGGGGEGRSERRAERVPPLYGCDVLPGDGSEERWKRRSSIEAVEVIEVVTPLEEHDP